MNNTKPHGMTKVVVQRRNKQFDMYLYETVVLGLQMDTDVYEKNNPSNYADIAATEIPELQG